MKKNLISIQLSEAYPVQACASFEYEAARDEDGNIILNPDNRPAHWVSSRKDGRFTITHRNPTTASLNRLEHLISYKHLHPDIETNVVIYKSDVPAECQILVSLQRTWAKQQYYAKR